MVGRERDPERVTPSSSGGVAMARAEPVRQVLVAPDDEALASIPSRSPGRRDRDPSVALGRSFPISPAEGHNWFG